MGSRFRKNAGEMFTRIVRDYPTSPQVKLATKRLEEMELPVPAASQAALERAKWEKENAKKVSMVGKTDELGQRRPRSEPCGALGAAHHDRSQKDDPL